MFFPFRSTPRKHWQRRDESCENNRVHPSNFWLSLSLSAPFTRVRIVMWTERLCLSGGGKSLRLKNASLPHDGRRTQAKADDVTRPCALGSQRIEESSRVCSSSNARAIFTHAWTSVSTYCFAHRDALAIQLRVLSASLPIFSQRGFEEKEHLWFFRWIFNMLHYIPLPLIHGKSTFAVSIICKKLLFKFFVCSRKI